MSLSHPTVLWKFIGGLRFPLPITDSMEKSDAKVKSRGQE
jgi:hypothetical protein